VFEEAHSLPHNPCNEIGTSAGSLLDKKHEQNIQEKRGITSPNIRVSPSTPGTSAVKLVDREVKYGIPLVFPIISALWLSFTYNVLEQP
jgi:hypothetical protein